MASPKASVIILTKNAGPHFHSVLDAVFAQEYASFEVILIDSGSTDGTIEIAQGFPLHFYQIPSKSFGHGKTRNFGASLAQGEYLVYLTQDALPANRYWLANLLRNLGKNGIAGVFGRQIPRLNTNPMEAYQLNRLYPEQRMVKSNSSPYPLRLKNIFFSNVNSAICRSVWEKNQFAENLIMSEDQFWAKQAILSGYKLVYEPKAAVYHSHNYTLYKLFKRNFDSGVSLYGLTEDRLPQIIHDYLKYLSDEIKELTCHHRIFWLPKMMIYEFIRGLGMLLGNQHRFMPLSLKRKLSLHSDYWMLH